MAARADVGQPLLVNVCGIPSGVERDDIEHYFAKKKFGGGEVTVIKFEENDDEALVSIKHLDSQGTYL